tara:strand:+ start:11073 stop:12296 length:1224 start_codon:yes stop_codon:yes gene_type:complete
MRLGFKRFYSVFFLLVLALNGQADSKYWSKFDKPLNEYSHAEYRAIGDVLIQLQRPSGGWGKRYKPEKLIKSGLNNWIESEAQDAKTYDSISYGKHSHRSASLDNGATHSYIRLLVRLAIVTKEQKYISSVLKGMHYLLDAQYYSGGWPQNYPNTNQYGGHITLNDGAMLGALLTLEDTLNFKPYFIDKVLRQKLIKAYEKGIKFLIDYQVTVKGVKTAWAAQYDAVTLKPAQGRIYEAPSIDARESTYILKFLMRIAPEYPEVIPSVEASVNWLNQVAMNHKQIAKIKLAANLDKQFIEFRENPEDNKPSHITFIPKHYDKQIIHTESDLRLWARFYDLDTLNPIYVDWGGKIMHQYDALPISMRLSYQWVGLWPEYTLVKAYPVWREKFLTKHVSKRIDKQLNTH